MSDRKDIGWQLWLIAGLIALSAAVYFLHYAIFHDAHHIFLYLIGDIAFVFIEVLMVTVVIHRLLTFREKRSLLKKLNMVIGTFYSEVGTGLMRQFGGFDPTFSRIAHELVLTNSWRERDYARMTQGLESYPFTIDHAKGDLPALRTFLAEKRPFLLTLMENPNLLEHESFTNLLWAVFHLTEELIHRGDLAALTAADYKHLEGDIGRVYRLLVLQWLAYMKHLQSDYPYLFSLAVRTNPFDPSARVEVS